MVVELSSGIPLAKSAAATSDGRYGRRVADANTGMSESDASNEKVKGGAGVAPSVAGIAVPLNPTDSLNL